ncbi:DUF6520 family protein [Gelidibacter sp. F63206]|uniref:DUF6520 family protein n=1 Tax=Gelidibacter sp. F63206 TaxID=2926425 RepID=UPI001FF18488|nr:DUF6520 family protein [Gelidibacter sp. F63206]MCK0115242.1 DUF6520 family protein [Gelidibacter sp. F63206]
MKVKIFKMVLPVFVLMLAVVSAFAFKSVEDKALLAPELGWINLSSQPCAIQVTDCDNTPSEFVCTAFYEGESHQVFGKTGTQPLVCNKQLFRSNMGSR